MKTLVILAVLFFAGDAFAQCRAQDLVGLGINNIQAQALGCDRLVGNTSITGTLTSSGALTTTAGGHTITAGGLTVTAGGATITAGKLSAGGSVVYPAALMETKAAAGANQGNSTALTAGKFIHMVTGADETTGVVLPACAAANIGEIHFVMNTVANKFLNIWPASGGNINGLGANAVYAGGATGQGRETHICACQAADVWYCG